jgi:hypothetical protein
VYSHNNLPDAQNGGNKQLAIENLEFSRDLRAAIYAEFEKGTNPIMVPDIVQMPK